AMMRRLGKFLCTTSTQPEVGIDVVDCIYDHRRLASACGIEQVHAGGIAVEDAEPETAQPVDVVRIVVKDGGLETAGEEEPTDDLPEASEAGDDHWSVLGLDTVGRAAALPAPVPLQQVGAKYQERRQHHRERHHQRENLAPVTG